MPDEPAIPRPSQLWKQLSPERKLLAAEAFWRDENAAVEQADAVATIAQRIKFRAKSVMTMPVDKKARQLVHLMAWLNPSPTAIDAAELSAAARLMNWLRIDPRTKELQIAVFIDEAKRKLAAAKANVPGFTGEDWPTALWIMDILHHGRGSYTQLRAAMAAANREQALKAIGWPTYRRRIQHIETAVEKLRRAGTLAGFVV